MDRRGFLRLIGLGLALGPEAIAEAMKPQIFYSIPASLGTAEMVWQRNWHQVPVRYMYGRVHLSAQMIRGAVPGFDAFMAQDLERLRRDITRQTWSLA